MSLLSERIIKALGHSGLSQAALGRACGIERATVNGWVKGRTFEISGPVLLKAARALRVSPDWLASGKGQMLSPAANTEPGPDTKGMIPLISWVNAGDWASIEDPYEVGDAEKWMPCPVSHGHNTFALRVRGTSMEPEYRDGDIIYVDPAREPTNSSHVIVRLEDEQEVTFKRLVIEGSAQYLEALNPAWPDKVIRINDNANIVGVVIFSGRER
ncbi:MAG: XRE family transcriptional regulator [Candidatus Sedimenticola sp. (ex Thyasira tokunagai)]